MRHLEFSITGDHITLDKLLKVTGICSSGGAAKALVATGGVSVDGARELRKTCKIRAGQVVAAADAQITVKGNAGGIPA